MGFGTLNGESDKHSVSGSVKFSKESIVSLNGRDIATLNNDEKAIFEFFLNQGRKYGVTVTYISEAPQEELKRATSREVCDQIIKRYPSRISVITQ